MSDVIPAGSTVSHYRIVSRIGAGGMGEVYKAQDLTLDRPVALKILPPEVVRNEDRVRRFVQEAKAASGLSHPHIVAIHEIGEFPLLHDGGEKSTRYIAMEFVHGETLRKRIHDGKTSLKELLEVLAQAADALAKAHAAGIIHRDLKPDNIMVTQEGYAKVLDFGLAKLTERPAKSGSGTATALKEQTREGVMVGTLGYMSPEQVRGQHVDHRSDIFSFGCILYEAATKQKPFVADSDIDVLHKIVHDEPPSVSEISPTTPAEVRRMIRRCLAKDPEKRYQSMKDLAIELRDLSQEFDTLEPHSGSASGETLRLPAMPRMTWTILIASGIFLLAILAVVLLRSRKPDAGKATALDLTFTHLTEEAGVESNPTISPDGNFVAYVSERSSNQDIYLQRIGGQKPINLTESTIEDDRQPAFSPDGQRIAFRSERQGGGIFLMGATGESVKRLTDFGYDPAWSPDGKKIVLSSEGISNPLSRGSQASLWSIDVESGQKRRLIEQGGDGVQPSWSPHGHRIAFWYLSGGGGQRDIATMSSTGGELVPVTSDAAVDWNPIWSPDGRYLYFSSDRGGSMNLWRVPIDEKSGKLTGPPEALTTPSRWSGDVSIAGDGRRIVFTALDQRSNIMKVAFDPVRETVSGGASPVTHGTFTVVHPDVSPDGQWVVFRTELQQEDLYLCRSDGTELRKLTDDAAKDRGPKWSPDGTRIAFYSDRSGPYEIWAIRPDGSGLEQLTSTSGRSPWYPRWSPDGSRLVVHNDEGSYLVELTGSTPVNKIHPLPPLGVEGRRFRPNSWSADGEWLAGSVYRTDGLPGPGIAIYSLKTGKYRIFTDFGLSPSWLSDSRRLVFTDRNKLFLLDRETGSKKEIFAAGSLIRTYVGVSRDDRTIFFSEALQEGDLWLLTMK